MIDEFMEYLILAERSDATTEKYIRDVRAFCGVCTKRLCYKGNGYCILTHTLKMMKGCVCGGAVGDSSCYSCLRSYKKSEIP